MDETICVCYINHSLMHTSAVPLISFCVGVLHLLPSIPPPCWSIPIVLVGLIYHYQTFRKSSLLHLYYIVIDQLELTTFFLVTCFYRIAAKSLVKTSVKLYYSIQGNKLFATYKCRALDLVNFWGIWMNCITDKNSLLI